MFYWDDKSETTDSGGSAQPPTLYSDSVHTRAGRSLLTCWFVCCVLRCWHTMDQVMLPGSGMGAALAHSRDSLLDTKLSFVTLCSIGHCLLRYCCKLKEKKKKLTCKIMQKFMNKKRLKENWQMMCSKYKFGMLCKSLRVRHYSILSKNQLPILESKTLLIVDFLSISCHQSQHNIFICFLYPYQFFQLR